MSPLDDIHVLSLAVNLPGPLAAARLRDLGATVVKVEPPQGDAFASACPGWYRALHERVEILRLDLKDAAGRAQVEERLARTDLLLTSFRPAALQRLGLSWAELAVRHPRLCQVAILGHPPPDEDLAGHDLTYQARLGLVEPPYLPRVVIADLAGAQEAVLAALAVLLARERGQGARYSPVSLADAAARFAEPLRRGLTTPAGILGGGFPGYSLYRTCSGWVALAALEPHFQARLTSELSLAAFSHEELQRVFLTRTATEWEAWAATHDLPLAAVRPE
jgi:crotonobetainyl-CoA:carnitine CoA-transferase CaiB-like acyl-CoA transferase